MCLLANERTYFKPICLYIRTNTAGTEGNICIETVCILDNITVLCIQIHIYGQRSWYVVKGILERGHYGVGYGDRRGGGGVK